MCSKIKAEPSTPEPEIGPCPPAMSLLRPLPSRRNIHYHRIAQESRSKEERFLGIFLDCEFANGQDKPVLLIVVILKARAQCATKLFFCQVDNYEVYLSVILN